MNSDCPELPILIAPNWQIPMATKCPDSIALIAITPNCSNSRADCPDSDFPASDLPWIRLPRIQLPQFHCPDSDCPEFPRFWLPQIVPILIALTLIALILIVLNRPESDAPILNALNFPESDCTELPRSVSHTVGQPLSSTTKQTISLILSSCLYVDQTYHGTYTSWCNDYVGLPHIHIHPEWQPSLADLKVARIHFQL